MKFCCQCGAEVLEGAAFCPRCGAAIVAAQAAAPEQVAPPTFAAAPNNAEIQEEQEFLDTTHRLLRWECKAWSIAGKAFTIMGIVIAALFTLFALIFSAIGDEMAAIAGGTYFFMAVLYGGSSIALGLVGKTAAKKIDPYLNTLHTDFKTTLDRCGSIGMLIFSVLLGAISPIFFIINFVRIKSGGRVIARILARQGRPY